MEFYIHTVICEIMFQSCFPKVLQRIKPDLWNIHELTIAISFL